MPKKNIKNHKKNDLVLGTQILDELPQNIDIVDENCKIIYLNKFLLKKVGKSAIGKKCYQVFKTDKKQCVNCPLKKPIKVGEVKTMEVGNIVGDRTFSIMHKGIKIGDKKYILEIFDDITEIKRTEESSINLINRFDEAQKVADIGSWEWDVQKNEVSWSDEAYRLFGLKPQSLSLTYERFLEFIHPDDKKRVMDIVANSVKTGVSFDYETRVVVKNKEFIYNGKGKVIKDKRGKAAKLFGIIQDITDRKKTEKELMQYKFIIEQSVQEIAFADFLGNIIFVNNAWAKNHGYTKEELIGKHLSIFHDKKELKNVNKFNKILKEKGKNSGEIVHKRKDGSVYHTLMNNFVLNVQGKPKFLIGMAVDITERKVAEEKSKRLSDIIEKTFEPIALIDLGKTNILNYVNPAWEKMFGYRAKEVVRKKVGLLLGASKLDPKLGVKLRHSIKTGKIFSAEMKWKRKNGKLIDVEVFSSPLRDEKGKIINWFNTIRDITESKEMREALQKSERRYRRLFETAKDSILILNAHNGKIVDANPFIQEFLGCSLKELVGKEIWRISPFRDIIKNKKKFLELKKAKYVHYENLPLETKTGKLKHVEFVSNVYGGNGEQVVQCNIRDITDIKRAEENLRDSQQKLNATVNSMGDGLFVVDSKGTILLFNHTASVISGFSARETVGSPYNKFIKFISEKTNLPNDNFIQVCLDEGKNIEIINHTLLIKKNNKRLPVSINASPLKDKDGNVVGAVVLFRDVSREREINQMKSEFVSLASHQLKTPLTGIKWFSELLLTEQSGTLNNAQKDYIQRVADSNERLITLVNDLLDVSHIITGRKFDIVKMPTDIVKIVDEVVQDKIILINSRKINVIKCAGAPDKLEVPIDGSKMRQVFDNLINNAIKYSKVGGVVELGCKKDLKDKVVIYIKDSGIGIPKHQQKRVYEKFFRSDNAVKAQTDGTGLGLYIAKAIVEAHGGEMWFKSEEGKGSTFYFSLPLNN